jgi:ATP-dependent DNA helicase RecG
LGAGAGRDGGAESVSAAARALEVLFAPIRFAARDGFAALPRLSGFADLVRGAVQRARAAGAPESTALRGLAAEADATHVLMNNCYRDYAQTNAAQLASLLGDDDDD